MYVSSLQLYNNTYFTYCQEGNIKITRILRIYYMQIPGKYADWQQDAPPIFANKLEKIQSCRLLPSCFLSDVT
ncbi:hypothetical protein D3Z47_17400 [Lachnospiraceae bacterium]|nr:hypothetical protein [Lachnospiraceae bacterium]